MSTITFSADELAPIIRAVVDEVLAQREAASAAMGGRLGFTEAEAAATLGLATHVLRDCRLRGEIHARRVGKRYVYSRAALIAWLEGPRR